MTSGFTARRQMIGEFPPGHFGDVADEGAVITPKPCPPPLLSNHQRAAVNIDDRPGRKAVRHEAEDLPRDILAKADAADEAARRPSSPACRAAPLPASRRESAYR